MDEPVLTETQTDTLGPYDTVWLCPVPRKGATFRVVEQQWDPDYQARTITSIEILSENLMVVAEVKGTHARRIVGPFATYDEARAWVEAQPTKNGGGSKFAGLFEYNYSIVADGVEDPGEWTGWK